MTEYGTGVPQILSAAGRSDMATAGGRNETHEYFLFAGGRTGNTLGSTSSSTNLDFISREISTGSWYSWNKNLGGNGRIYHSHSAVIYGTKALLAHPSNLVLASLSITFIDLVSQQVLSIPLSYARAGSSVALLGPLAYIAGGLSNPIDLTSATRAVEVFDMRDRTKYVAAELRSNGTALMAATTLRRPLVIFAGMGAELKEVDYYSCGNNVIDGTEACDMGANCTDLCVCPPGFQSAGLSCADIDECTIYNCSTFNSSRIDGTCANGLAAPFASRTCECPVGTTGTANVPIDIEFAGCEGTPPCSNQTSDICSRH